MLLIVYKKAGLDVTIVRSIRLSSNPNLKEETNLSGGVSIGSQAATVNDDNSFFDSLSRTLSDKRQIWAKIEHSHHIWTNPILAFQA